jgi:multiple sugar transport system ATP-binding protein
MAEVVLRNIEKIYPNTEKKKHNLKVTDEGVLAVENFNLTIKDHEFIVLVGPSGCGKSTTLRMVAGLEDITRGELYIDGQLMNDVEPKDRDIAMVFQNYALYPHMTVRQNMEFPLKLRKMPKDQIKRRLMKQLRSWASPSILTVSQRHYLVVRDRELLSDVLLSVILRSVDG